MTNKKYHFVYKTIRLDTNEYYIGIRSTDNVDDGYLGSGHRIKAAVRKHGRENFQREILFMCQTRNEALDHERDIVTKQLLQDPLCLNLTVGGRGLQVDHLDLSSKEKIRLKLTGKSKTEQHKQKLSDAAKGRPKSEDHKQKLREIRLGTHHKAESKIKVSQARTGQPKSEQTKRRISEARKGKPSPLKGIPRSDETKRKMAETKLKNKLKSQPNTTMKIVCD